MENGNFDEICGSAFWDWNVTWYTDNPRFTECFQQTVLVWVPCAFLWAFLPFEAYYILNSKSKNVPWNWLNVAKMVMTLLLLILSVIELGSSIYQKLHGFEVYPVNFYTPVVKIATFGLSVGLTAVSRAHGRTTSGVQFIFWLLLVVFGAPELRHWVSSTRQEAQFEADEVYGYISYVIHYCGVLTMFFLSCFADQRPLVSEYPSHKHQFPEDTASFLSKLLYLWLDPLMWKGFRKPLTTKDLWTISPYNSSRYVVPLFDKQWDKIVQATGRAHVTKASFSNHGNNIEFVESKPKRRKQASVLPAICRTFWVLCLLGSALKFVSTALLFISPQILRYITSELSHLGILSTLLQKISNCCTGKNSVIHVMYSV